MRKGIKTMQITDQGLRGKKECSMGLQASPNLLLQAMVLHF
jgi:hypothetical protein